MDGSAYGGRFLREDEGVGEDSAVDAAAVVDTVVDSCGGRKGESVSSSRASSGVERTMGSRLRALG